MEEKKVTFSVQMTAKELYRFKLYHAYHKFSGIVGVILSVAAIIALITSFTKMTEQTRAVLILVAVWFILFEPVKFYVHAKGQVKRSEVYKHVLNYAVDETGISISQGEQQQMVEWKQLFKIVETKKQFLVYSGPMYAFIFPKEQLGESCCEEFRQFVLEYTKNTHVQLKGIRKL